MKVTEASNKDIQINLLSVVDLISLNKYMLQTYFFRLIYSGCTHQLIKVIYNTEKIRCLDYFFFQLKE